RDRREWRRGERLRMVQGPIGSLLADYPSRANRCFFFSSRRRHTRFSRDWSSDVCSSDLVGSGAGVARISAGQVDFGASEAPMTDAELAAAKGGAILHIPLVFGAVVPAYHLTGQKSGLKFSGELLGKIRSEEHTSELQSRE